MPKPRCILETVLYAEDLDLAEQFYTNVMCLKRIMESEDLFLAYRITAEQVLLIFNPDEAAHSDRSVPSHGAHGTGHVAFEIDSVEYEKWKNHLRDLHIPVEHEYNWHRNARSIYLRDPAGNSVELITKDIWPE